MGEEKLQKPNEENKEAQKAPEVPPAAPEAGAGQAAAAVAKPRQRRDFKRRDFSQRKPRQDDGEGFIEKVVAIKRVAKVVKGGRRFSFNALVVAGDGKGKVGVGFGKGNEIAEAIRKGLNDAKKSFVKISVKGTSIPHEIIGHYKAARVLLKPAVEGTGVIAGGSVRALCDAVGIKDILTKSLGSDSALNVVKAALDGFTKLRYERKKTEEEVA